MKVTLDQLPTIQRYVAFEYAAVKRFYGDRCAKRSKVPLMNHIDEGLVVMAERGASILAMRAFCIHPLFQEDEPLKNFGAPPTFAGQLDAGVVLLAMEYRYTANAYLSQHVSATGPKLSPLVDVNEMLVADKIQNRKDFLIHHKDKHLNSKVLEFYFDQWLRALDVSQVEVDELTELIS